MNAEAMNQLQRILIDHANANGINLRDEFKTDEAFKQFQLSLAFTALKDAGLATDVAFDFIFGDGAYEKMANEVWEQLNAA